MYQVPNQNNQNIYNSGNNPPIRNFYNSANIPNSNSYQNYSINHQQDQSKMPLYFGPKKVLNHFL
jgi:hypothetical protein